MKKNKAIIRNGKIIYEEATVIKPNENSAKFYRDNQKAQFRKDLLQKNEVGYYKAYPKQAEELDPDLRRLLS